MGLEDMPYIDPYQRPSKGVFMDTPPLFEAIVRHPKQGNLVLTPEINNPKGRP